MSLSLVPSNVFGSISYVVEICPVYPSAFTYTGKVIRVKKDDNKLIDKETKEDLSNYIYADKDGYVSISAGSANNLATNVDDVAYARINLIIGTPETGKFKNYNITAEGDNHRTIETTNTFKVTSRDLSDVNVSIKAKTYNDKKKVTIDKNDITFTDKNGYTLDLYKDVVPVTFLLSSFGVIVTL